MTFAHVMGGPLDPLIELGLPLLIFIGLYFWSSRGERSKHRREADRRLASGDPAYVLTTRDLRALAAKVEAQPADDAARALRTGIASELARRTPEVKP